MSKKGQENLLLLFEEGGLAAVLNANPTAFLRRSSELSRLLALAKEGRCCRIDLEAGVRSIGQDNGWIDKVTPYGIRVWHTNGKRSCYKFEEIRSISLWSEDRESRQYPHDFPGEALA